MRTHLVYFFLSLSLFLSETVQVKAWGANGHRVTAEIGDRNINAHTKSVITSIVGDRSLAEIATWPDDIRSDKSWNFSHPWHFFSINDDETWEGVTRDEAGDVLSELEKLEEFLSDQSRDTIWLNSITTAGNSKTSKEEVQRKKIGKQEALSFYVHFVGDIHQPLHVGRREDFGGNKIGVVWFGKDTNLHKVWDELLLNSRKLSFSELSTFLNHVSDDDRQKWSNSDYLDWAKESKSIREKIYNFGQQKAPYYLNVSTPPVLKWDYRYETLSTINDQLVKGGIRLAAKLDLIFADYQLADHEN